MNPDPVAPLFVIQKDLRCLVDDGLELERLRKWGAASPAEIAKELDLAVQRDHMRLERDAALMQLSSVDEALARRPALEDLPDRYSKVSRACTLAGQLEALQRQFGSQLEMMHREPVTEVAKLRLDLELANKVGVAHAESLARFEAQLEGVRVDRDEAAAMAKRILYEVRFLGVTDLQKRLETLIERLEH